KIQQCGAHAVYESVASVHHSVIDHEPSLVRFDRDGASTDFCPLPPLPDIAAAPFHDQSMHSPMTHVWALAQINVAERRVPVVAGAAEHDVFATDLAWKQHAITVERQERIFYPFKNLEVARRSDTDGRTIVAATPSDVIRSIDFAQPRIVG